MHASLLNKSAYAIRGLQNSRRDALSFHQWFQLIADELLWLDNDVSTNLVHTDHIALRPHIQSLADVDFQLMGLHMDDVPDDWGGRLADTSAYRRLWRNLHYDQQLPDGEPPELHYADQPPSENLPEDLPPPMYSAN